MEKLIAKAPILYFNKQFEPGDELPRFDSSMEKAWIESGCAVLIQDSPIAETAVEEIKPKKRKKKV